MKICCLKTCLSLAVGCFLPLVSYADSIYRVVPDEASKSIPGWENASTDLKGTIEGVNVAGSTVLVMNGHYNIGEQITFKNATAGSLTIRSVNPATGETDFGGAIFDAKKDNPGNEVRLFAAEREIAFYGCQLVNGRVDGNGGAALGKICAYDCVISNNTASGDGGAVGSTWGGVCAGVFSNCLFACNQAKKQYAGGGAFFTFSGSPTFYDCVFSNNTVNAGSGAAVYVKQGCEDLAIERCTFVENDGTDDLCGAVVFVGDGVAVARPVTDCRFAGNRGISLSGAQTPLLRCEFAQNMCDQPFATKALVESCIITNNTCSFFSCNKAIVSNLRNCLVADNRFNAAIFRMHSSYPAICRISNCTFTKNTASYSYSLYDSPNENQGVSMTNTVFYDNAISKTFDSKTFDSLVGCTVGFANNCTDDASLQELTTSSGGGLVVEDPKFVDALAGDFRIGSKSSCREKALTLGWMTDAAVDLAGNPRVLDRNGRVSSGARPDIGCYECDEWTPGMAIFVR